MKDSEVNRMFDNQLRESRLVALRDCCNGRTQVGFDGFRYFHRTYNVVKKLRAARNDKNFFVTIFVLLHFM
jgi:hypothetical protein